MFKRRRVNDLERHMKLHCNYFTLKLNGLLRKSLTKLDKTDTGKVGIYLTKLFLVN